MYWAWFNFEGGKLILFSCFVFLLIFVFSYCLIHVIISFFVLLEAKELG